jgi:restriction endonuclease S subunit
MSTRSNKRILQDRLEDQAKEVHRLQQLMAQKDAEKEAEKQELATKLKQELMQEVRTMMAQNNNLLPTQEVMHEIRLYNFLYNVLN